MPTTLEDKKVSEMTAKELRGLIKDTLMELTDPDYGMELRPEVQDELRKSIKSKKRVPVKKVAEKLGLKW